MSVLKGLSRNVAIQSCGIAALLLANLLVARIGGPDLQGRFYAFKSINDFQVALLNLGLPSGIIYYINKTSSGAPLFHRLSWQYAALLLLPLIAADAAVLTWLLPGNSDVRMWLTDTAFIAAGSSAMVAYTMQRGILLTQNDGDLFAAVSSLPSFLFLVFLPLSVLLGFAPISSAYFAVGMLSLASIHAILSPSLSGAPVSFRSINWRLVFTQSGHVFAQALAYGMQPLITIGLLNRSGGSSEAAGLFNIASLVFVLPNLLMSMVAPVFYNRWSKSLNAQGLKKIARNAALIAIAVQALAFLSWPLVEPVTVLIFGDGFRGSTPLIKLMLAGVGPLAFTRIMSPAFQGTGSNRMLTFSCFLRLLPMAVLGFYMRDDILTWAAISWAAGEYLAAAALAAALAKNPGNIR
jgi:O-antigen/teichoic acid export membrane protein